MTGATGVPRVSAKSLSTLLYAKGLKLGKLACSKEASDLFAMKKTLFARSFSTATMPLALAACLVLGGCSKQAPSPQQAASTAQPAQPANQVAPNAAATQATNPSEPVQPPVSQAAPAQQANNIPPPLPVQQSAPVRRAAPAPVDLTIPVGTHISVTTREELSSKTSQAGQSFTATVANNVVVGGTTVVRAGSSATGTVVSATNQGRIKGQGELSLRLDSIHSGGRDLEVETSALETIQKGKGKRTAVLAGGGAGVGALIGGLAGGGKGALLGGLLGGGGGAAGGIFTGNKAIVIPAETTLTFRLEHSVTVRR